MGGNGKHRWKFSIYKRKSSKKSEIERKEPPVEFLCPISGSLMADPVIISSGQTFERVSTQICRDLNFSPKLEDGSIPDFSTVIPNLSIKSTILNWCDNSRREKPQVPDYSSVERIVRSLMEKERKTDTCIRASERELLKTVADKPPVNFSHAATELGRRVNHFYSSSSEESVVVGPSPGTPLPFKTRPTCYSSSSSSTEIVESETLNRILIPNSSSSSEEAKLLSKLKSPEVFDQEEGVKSLRKIARNKEESRVLLCTPMLLLALKPLISSRYSTVQANAVASLVNLSLEKPNKLKIVRSGFVPFLIDVLKGGSNESQEHAAGALFSLALEDENKMAIGVLGALQPLMHALRSESERTRHDSALCLYNLTLTQSNRVKLVKLGAVPMLLSMVESGNLADRVLLILCNLAICSEGRSKMLDGNAVGILVGMLREEGKSDSTESTRENCVAALYALSHGGFRFKGLAEKAGAMEVLREIEERGSERGRDKARKILQMMRARAKDMDDEEVESVLDSGGLSWTQNRVGKNLGTANSTNF